jgi:hypothetical protein
VTFRFLAAAVETPGANPNVGEAYAGPAAYF